MMGGFFRWQNLATKPPWTDEFATLVFSLGHNFNTVALNRVLKLEDILAPLRPEVGLKTAQVIDLLLNEDNHPPLYFVLAHWWYALFPAGDGYLDVALGRSPSVWFGIVSIPLSYFIVRWLKPQNRLLPQGVALLMALSPYGVFIAQEARHYSLAVLWILASLGCCLKASQQLAQGRSLPLSLVGAWSLVNALALTTHFFTGLFLLAEFLGLGMWFWERTHTTLWPPSPIWLGRFGRPLAGVMLATLITALIWVSIITQRGFGNGMTQWLALDQRNILAWLGPVAQLLAAWITMFTLLPVESPQLLVALISGVGMLVYLLSCFPKIKAGLQLSRQGENASEVRLLVLIWGWLIFLYLAIAYGVGMDITRGARYSFNFLPLLILLGAWGLGEWTRFHPQRFNYWAVVLLMGIISSGTVNHNLGYQKYYRPEQLLTLMAQTPPTGLQLLVTTHQSLVQTGEMMGLGLEAQRHFPQLKEQLNFALIPQSQINSPEATKQLSQLVNRQQKPLDLWLVNFLAPVELPQCHSRPQEPLAVNGYNYRHLICPAGATANLEP
jgi:uncharacterized membrane protein